MARLIFNWKMNGSKGKQSELIDCLLEQSIQQPVVLCVPYVYLSTISQRIQDQPMIQLGAQDVSDQTQGAYTGEISAQMLQEFGVQVCLVGHSERRRFHESDTMVIHKVHRLLDCQIQPVICVAGQEHPGTVDQECQALAVRLQALCADPVIAAADVMIAYEPIWAIGQAQAAQVEHIQAVHQWMADYVQSKMKGSITWLYGGSLNFDNLADIMALNHIDGGLIGGSGLNTSFLQVAVR